MEKCPQNISFALDKTWKESIQDGEDTNCRKEMFMLPSFKRMKAWDYLEPLHSTAGPYVWTQPASALLGSALWGTSPRRPSKVNKNRLLWRQKSSKQKEWTGTNSCEMNVFWVAPVPLKKACHTTSLAPYCHHKNTRCTSLLQSFHDPFHEVSSLFSDSNIQGLFVNYQARSMTQFSYQLTDSLNWMFAPTFPNPFIFSFPTSKLKRTSNPPNHRKLGNPPPSPWPEHRAKVPMGFSLLITHWKT